MPREPEPSTNERDFVLQALRQGIRIDGRSLDAVRDVQISFGDEYGLADVRWGRTRILTRVSAEVTQPFPDRPFEGIFTITTELSPLASPAFDVGRQTELETILSRLLEKAVRRPRALDVESLCLVAARHCWHVRADVHVLDHDGGLVDASCIGVIAALLHFRRPEVTVAPGSYGGSGDGVVEDDKDAVTVWPAAIRVPVPLAVLHRPLCVTLTFFGDGEIVLVDATLQEQLIGDGELVVTANAHGEVCQLAKLGGVPAEALTMLRCVELAVEKAKELDKVIRVALERDEKRRNLGNLLVESQAEADR